MSERAAAERLQETRDELSLAERTARAMFPDDPHRWPGAELIIETLVNTTVAFRTAELEAENARLRKQVGFDDPA